MAIQGLANTTTFDSPGPLSRRPQNFREMILMLYPNGGGIEKAPLTALTAVMKSEVCTDPVFHWFTKQLQDRRLILAANLDATNSGVTENITVDGTFSSALQLKAGDMLMVENTNEILYVASTPASATTISVIRGFTVTGTVAQPAVGYTAAGTNPYLAVIGSAFEEGSAPPDPIHFDPIELFNQLQIFRGTYGLTNTAREVITRTGPEEAEAKREALELMGVDMEKGFFFGQKTTTIRNGQPLRTTNGINAFIPAANRYTPPSGQMSYEWFESISTNLFRYGSTEKMAFCGGTFMLAVSQFVRLNGRGQYDLSDPVKEYGMPGIRRLTTPMGSIVLKVHPLFSQMQGGTTGGVNFTSMDNAAFILDMANIKYRFLKNRDIQFQDNLQAPGVDAKLAGWIGECGLEMHHPATHSFISGVQKGIRDPSNSGIMA
jgi:hypothetical protein